MPSGQVHMGGGMMMHPVTLPQNATRPVVRQLGATQRGDYTVSCLTYCGYGHSFMEIDGGLSSLDTLSSRQSLEFPSRIPGLIHPVVHFIREGKAPPD
jgi:hypothetical protein